jgi:hypothetical protein
MANLNKNIVITPNTGSSINNPTVEFTGFSSTPVTVSISTDTSPKLVFSPKELIKNGKFLNGTTDWTAGTGGTLSASNGVLRITNTGTNGRALSNRFSTVIGKEYTVKAVGVTRTGSNYRIEIRDPVGGSFTFIETQSGVTKWTFTATYEQHYLELYAIGSSGTYVEWSNISVKAESGEDLLQIDSSDTEIYSVSDENGFPIISVDSTSNDIFIGSKTGITTIGGKGLILPNRDFEDFTKSQEGLIAFDATNKTLKCGDGKTWIDLVDNSDVNTLKQYALNGQLIAKWDTFEKLNSYGGITTVTRNPEICGHQYQGTNLMYKVSGVAAGNWNSIADKGISSQPDSDGLTLVWWAKEGPDATSRQRFFDFYPTQCYWMDKQDNTNQYNFGGHFVNFAEVSNVATFNWKVWRMYAITMNTGRGPTTKNHTVYFSHQGEIYFSTGTTGEARGCGTLAGFMGYNAGSDAYSYNGWFGQCRYYKRVLTRGQIIALYNDGYGRFDWW